MLLFPIAVHNRAAHQIWIVEPRCVVLHAGCPKKSNPNQRIFDRRVHGNLGKGPSPHLADSTRGDLGYRIWKFNFFLSLVLVSMNVSCVKQNSVDGVFCNHGSNVFEVGSPSPFGNVAPNNYNLEGSPRGYQLGTNPLGLFVTQSIFGKGVAIPLIVRDNVMDVSPIKTVINSVGVPGVAFGSGWVGPQGIPCPQGFLLPELISGGIGTSVIVVVPHGIDGRVADKISKMGLGALLIVPIPIAIEIHAPNIIHVKAVLEINRVARQDGKIGIIFGSFGIDRWNGLPSFLERLFAPIHARGQDILKGYTLIVAGQCQCRCRCRLEGSTSNHLIQNSHFVSILSVWFQVCQRDHHRIVFFAVGLRFVDCP
mmetsp:Transcript_2499/g.6016  ORF Transcript_2499/g.6016 Transcript_2499/m.6016 type:complete len:368 (+) Transcript_2499:130-1233(+)